VRSVSNPDANGDLQVVQREIKETTTTKTGNNVEETTKTTVMLPGPEGGLAPAMMTQERSTQTGQTLDSQKTTFLPDGNGTWQVGEVQETKTQQQGNDRTTEQQVSRPDADGTLSEVSKKVSKESVGAGEKRSTADDYSINVPGTPQDGALHLVERVIATESTPTSGQQNNTTKIEQLNPGNPDAGLRVTIMTSDALRTGSSGMQATETIRQLNANDDMAVVSVDTSESNSNAAVQVQIAPPEKPQQ
jgi:hypothetical protein